MIQKNKQEIKKLGQKTKGILQKHRKSIEPRKDEDLVEIEEIDKSHDIDIS